MVKVSLSLCSGHASGQHAQAARVFPAPCSMADGRPVADGRDRGAPARADGVEPQRAAHRASPTCRCCPRARSRRRALRRSLAGRPFAEVWVSPRQRAAPHRRARRADRRRRSTTTWSRSTTAATRAGRRRRSARSSAASGRSGADGTVPGDDARARRWPRSARAWTGCSTGSARGWPTATSPWSPTGTCCACSPPAGWGSRPEAGALFALPAGSYGVLGHEHDRPVLTGWALH